MKYLKLFLLSIILFFLTNNNAQSSQVTVDFNMNFALGSFEIVQDPLGLADGLTSITGQIIYNLGIEDEAPGDPSIGIYNDSINSIIANIGDNVVKISLPIPTYAKFYFADSSTHDQVRVNDTDIAWEFISGDRTGLSGDDGTFTFSLLDDDHNVLSNDSLIPLPVNGWDEFALTICLNSDTETPFFAIGVSDYQNQINVSVDAVPIPSALWLLGSGLLGIVGIRRKYRN